MFNIHRGRGNMPLRRRLPRCVNCSFTVPNNMHTHSLDELSNSMLNVLRSWIAPTSIPDGGILCAECFMLLQEQATPDMVREPDFGHQNVCMGCGRSLLRARTYRVSRNCPERNVFLRRIPEHQIPDGGILCAECFMLLQEQATPDMVREPDFGHQNVCMGCGRSLLRARTYRVSRNCPERNVFLRRIPEHQVIMKQNK